MSSHFVQQWDLVSGDLQISIESPDQLPGAFYNQLGAVVIVAIEDFLKVWGPQPPPPMPDWERKLLGASDA